MTETDLFSPYQLGPMRLANRVVMAPLTRSRVGNDGVPTELTATYYGQRASAGLIVSEATNITPQGKGYAWTPGIWSDAQVAGWRKVTEAVHAKGGHMVLQLWHVGRISHPSLQPAGGLPVAPSPVRPEGKAFTEEGFKPHPTPRALRGDEIPGIIEDYRHATRQALAAGFDGVEIHGANGYLLDQFMRSGTNYRTDRYGGSLENRLRLTLEVARAVAEVAGAERTGIRISPVSPANDMRDDDPAATFMALADGLSATGLAYLHVIEGATRGPREMAQKLDYVALRRRFRGSYMANNGFNLELALRARAEDRADLICFGRPFISNPDLVERLQAGAPLAEAEESLFYGGGARGYIDYPALAA